MTELTPDAKELLAAARDGDEPTPDDELRNYNAITAAIAAGGAATTAASAGTAGASALTSGAGGAGGAAAGTATAAAGLSTGAKIALVTAVVVGVGTGTVAVTEYGAPNAPVHDAPVAATVDDSPNDDRVPETTNGTPDPEATAAGDEPATDALAAEAEPTVGSTGDEPATTYDDPATTPPSSAGRRIDRSGAPAAASPTGAGPAGEPAATPDPLLEETALLREAERARRSGDARAALAAIDHHRQRFPRGQLVRDREVARVLVLCDLGRVDEARALGMRLTERYPNTPLAARIAASCAGAQP